MTSAGGITSEKRRTDGTAAGWWNDARKEPTRYGKRGALITATGLLAGEVLAELAARGIAAASGARRSTGVIDFAGPAEFPTDEPFMLLAYRQQRDLAQRSVLCG